MQKIKSKKGFTLAELLIVVAIIAVLTAIAVPLFVNAVNNAEDRVKDANLRAVHAEAVNTILTDDAFRYSDKDKTTAAKYWEVSATLDRQGNIKTITVTPKSDKDGTAAAGTCTKTATDDAYYTISGMVLTIQEVQGKPV